MRALAVFFLIVIVAIVLGIVGVAVKGLIYLLAIGVIVFLLDLVLLGRSLRRRQRPSR